LAALLTATWLAALLAPAALLFVAITLLAATALFATITIALFSATALLASSLPRACGFGRFVRVTFCFHDYLSLFYLLSLLIGLFALRDETFSFSEIASEGGFGLENFISDRSGRRTGTGRSAVIRSQKQSQWRRLIHDMLKICGELFHQPGFSA
jgi:hypothetical protein